jgi:uncharacterized protein (DUF1697 family)
VASIVYVAFLRGINVGGNNMVSMKALKEAFERARFADVSTYINSGNVLFRSRATDPRRLERKIDDLLAAAFGLTGKTVVRNQPEMEQLLKTIEKTWRPDPDWRYNVIFLRHSIDNPGVIKDLAARPEIERVVYCPGTLLWSARVDGLARSAMIKLAARPIYQDMTVRNLNTTTKVLQLMKRMNDAGASR